MDGVRRSASLDVLRAAAIFLVLGNHVGSLTSHRFPWLRNFVEAWIRGGWVGVDLFFVLSGFLVSGLLFREYQRSGTLDVPRFLWRRGMRIYPAFWTLLLATWLGFRWFGLPHTSGNALLAELLFVQNYASGMWNHTWSLAVEEHFYVALPLALLALLWFGRGKQAPFARVVPL